MAHFQELIKNFDRIRDYMRQFYVYGFKVRGEGLKAGCPAAFPQITLQRESRSPSAPTAVPSLLILFTAPGNQKALQTTICCCTFLFCIT